MFGSTILEVVIGIVFVFLLVSIICSAIREMIEAAVKSRAAYLEYGIRELLHDKQGVGLANSFYNHPLIYSLFAGDYPGPLSIGRPSILVRGGKLPSYIPSRNFAMALMDIAARGQETDAISSNAMAPIVSPDSLRMNVRNLRNPAVQRVLLTALDSAQNDLSQVQASLEDWYNSAMERLSGRYKWATQWILFAIGIVLAVGLNVNTITVGEYLYRDDAARAVIVARAEAAARDSTLLRATSTQARAELDSLRLPIGWTEGWGAPRQGTGPMAVGVWNNWFGPITGWLLTALAATLGAPFWFDVLNKITMVRSTKKPVEKRPEELLEDRQRSKPQTLVVYGTGAGAAARDGGVPAEGGAAVRPSLVVGPEFSPPESADALDGCGALIEDETTDEELPAADGGVA